MRVATLLLISVFLMLTFQSCMRKGCMDKSAINYDLSADKDDGSCRYCEQSEQERGDLTLYVIDYNSSSQFYNQTVLVVDMSARGNIYNDLSCGDENCVIDFTFTNVISKNMDIDFDVSVSPNGGWSWYYQYTESNGATIPANSSTQHIGWNTQNPVCSDITGAWGNVYVGSISYF